jgi:predicted RNA binding protein YcfA (HicA-like mRNA interferase family)
LPALKASQVIRALERAGFVVVRTSGSHKVLDLAKDPRRTVIVPDHGSQDLKRGTVRGIIKQSGLTVEDFLALL